MLATEAVTAWSVAGKAADCASSQTAGLPARPSKQAFATNTTQPTLCIGDINRMTTQFARAGGAVCFSDAIATAFQAAVTQTNTC